MTKKQMLDDLMEVRLEITRINQAAGSTIFNPAATAALVGVIERLKEGARTKARSA